MAAIKKGEVVKAFDAFGDRLEKNAKDNLKVLGKGGGRLERRMDHFTKEFKNSFLFQFFMEDYGKFVDKGVKGVGGVRKSGDKKGQRWKVKKVDNNKYSFKSGSRDNIPGPRHFDKWIIRKGLAPRSSGGQFVPRSSIKFAISQSVYREGIETTNFFTAPFERGFERLPDEIIEAYALDAEKFFNSTT